MRKIKLSMPDLKLARNRKDNNVTKALFKLEDEYKNLGKNKTFIVHTYGCQGNEADSEIISGILLDLGYTKVDTNDADVVILNTCAVRENAENRIWGVLGNLDAYKKKNPDMIIAISGCMPQEENVAQRLIEKYPIVDLIFGTHNIKNLPKLLYQTYLTKAKVVEVISSQGEILEGAPKNRNNMHKAWVNIMYGCDEFCTYCIVPYTRGKERSRDKDDILKEINELVKQGYKEVTLLGQNVNAYGKDKDNNYTFGNLLYDIDKTGIQRVRFTTSHPRDLDDLTIMAMKECQSVMPHLHLPVQSGSNEILKKMNRKYTIEEYLEKIKKVKENIPNISITTDIIVGFPNESYDDFLETVKLVKDVEFEGAFTFIYSKRVGTPAATYADNVTPEEKSKRLQELNQVVNDYYKKGNERFVNKIVKVLVDSVSKNDDDFLCGYTENMKLTNFKSNDKSLIGRIVDVKITEAKTWFLMGELVE